MLPNWEKQYREAKGISQSHLKLFIKHPLNFKNYIYSEDRRSRSFDLGNLVDCLLFYPNEFNDRFYVMSPNTDTPSSPNQLAVVEKMVEVMSDPHAQFTPDLIRDIYTSNYSTKGVKAEALLDKATELHDKLYPYAMSQFMGKDKTVISFSDAGLAESLIENIQKHKFYEQLSKYELVNKRDLYSSHGSLAIKGLVDDIRINAAERQIIITDLKTTANIAGFKYQAKDYGYPMQLSFYAKLVAKQPELMKGIKTIVCYNLVVETGNSNAVTAVKYSNLVLQENAININLYLGHIEKYLREEKQNPNIWNYYPHELENGFVDYSQLW